MLFTIILMACSNTSSKPDNDAISQTKLDEVQTSDMVVVDIDGNKYKTIRINGTVWMAENLRVRHYNNGDPILHVKSSKSWSTLKKGAFCAFENNEDNAANYGLLYNFFALTDPRGLCPKGFRLLDSELHEYANDSHITHALFNNKAVGWRRMGDLSRDEEADDARGYFNEQSYGVYWGDPKLYSAKDKQGDVFIGGDYGEYIWGYQHDGLSVRCVQD